ncbi:MAG: ATP-binding cassette domain-containing protein [Bacteroidetes bacterium]|nr:ATP-binding cassette domain-containing protein [Bacteroidota bacterium]
MNEAREIIKISGLSKRFGDIQAVEDLNLTVYSQDIYGFLGPNGSGKSTTIRMMLSLVRPDKGSVHIFGMPLQGNRKAILSRIGALVEKPDFYDYLTAYKNLEILATYSGKKVSASQIMDVLALTGLHDRAESKVKTFSKGMKQRLGIAQALLHQPELIILDEPTAGLDPQGVKDVRDLIIQLNSEMKKTILLSSHQLHEIEQLANRMIIIDMGRAVVEGYVAELLKNENQSLEGYFLTLT